MAKSTEKAMTKTPPFAVSSAEVIAAVDDELKIAALRSASFEHEAKVRDLTSRYEAALAELRIKFLEAVRLIHDEDE